MDYKGVKLSGNRRYETTGVSSEEEKSLDLRPAAGLNLFKNVAL